jgi:SEC-C motif-containing protein
MLCPCCSGKPFKQCCGPFLSGQQHARTVKQLMRSRYCAFALGDYGDYLLATWHPSTRPDINAEDLGRRDTQWILLEVLESDQQGDKGTVTFCAHWRDESQQQHTHREHSRFERIAGRWYYLDGDVKQ